MMTNEKHFDLSQRCRLANYLKKFDKAANYAVSSEQTNSDKTDKKRKVQVEYDNEFSKKNRRNNDKINVSKSNQMKSNQMESDQMKSNKNKLGKVIHSSKEIKPENEGNRSDKLRKSCVEKLMSSQFRNINQYLYENPTVQAIRYMTPDIFKKYHEIYSQIVDKWPVKPLGKLATFCLYKYNLFLLNFQF